MISGNIPAEEGCPYSEDCAHFNFRCPTDNNTKPYAYPCWAARAWHMLQTGGESVPLRNLVQRVRKVIPATE